MPKLILTKAQKIQIGIYAFLILGTLIFGLLFKVNYDRFMSQEGNQEEQVEKIEDGKANHVVVAPPNVGLMFTYGGIFVLFSIALGLTLGRYLSAVVAEKFVDTLHGNTDTSKFLKKADYEKAEEEWAKSNFLRAIELFREYLAENPNEIHAAIRIAEIYEKDLSNYLAAAMEYEEILKSSLPDEQWGWTAVHLCNLYISKLDRPNDAVELLKRIAIEYEFTAAAEKARKHLEKMGITVETPDDTPKIADEDLHQKDEKAGKKRISLKDLPASEQLKHLND